MLPPLGKMILIKLMASFGSCKKLKNKFGVTYVVLLSIHTQVDKRKQVLWDAHEEM